MRQLAAVLVLLFAATIASAADFPSIPKKMILATHRLIVTYTHKDKHGDTETVTEKGTAVSVDLTSFGYPGSRYMLTAAHCVENYDKKSNNLMVEIIRPGKTPRWTLAHVVADDRQMDIAIIVADADMSDLVELATKDDIDIGDAAIAIGSPKGMAISATIGYLSSKGEDREKGERNFWQASMPIFHGNSGGGMFDANRNNLIGIVTALIQDSEGSVPNIALFVAYPQINQFIKDNLKRLELKPQEH